MKRLITALAVVMLTAPAMAADWSFYGSQRMATFWDHVDYGDNEVNGEGDDDSLIWDFQTNSRLGAKVKADKVSGRIELGLKGSDGGDVDVGTRLAYGVWQFSDNASLKVGKDYGLIYQGWSNSVFDADNDLNGIGTGYGFRIGEILLQIGGLQLALVTPRSQDLGTGGDVDVYLPKFEGKYSLKLDTITFAILGGYQWYKIDQTPASTLTDDIDVTSWIVGGEVLWNIGAFYVNGGFNYGQNWTSARWNDLGYTNNANAGAVVNAGGDDVEDCTSWQAALVVGMKFTDTITFEVGGGYRSDDQDAADNEDDAWQIYGQAVISLAPGVSLVPEIGYFDYMDNPAGNDEGYEWYAGAKWQIDF